MARLASIDKQAALEMMQAGEKDSVIGVRFGTSRQAVNLLRKSFVKEGKLDMNIVNDEQVLRTGTVVESASQQAQTGGDGSEPSALSTNFHPSLDQIGDWLIQTIREAIAARKLRQENSELIRSNELLQVQVAKLQDELKKTQEKLSLSDSRSLEFDSALRDLSDLPATNTPQA